MQSPADVMLKQRYTSYDDISKYYGFEDKEDYKNYEIRNAMTKIYKTYFALWLDFDVLLSFLAIFGLGFNLVAYTELFY